DSNGFFSWTPTEAQGPASYTFDVVVSDDQNPAGTDRETITVTVNETNNAPILSTIGNQSIEEGSLLLFTATAIDSDVPTQTLSYSLNNAPTGANIDNNGLFSWTPTEAQGPNSFTFDIVVSDDGNPVLSDTETISVTVSESNTAPILDAIGNKNADETNTLTFTATANDTDSPTQTLSFTLDGAPTGAAIDNNGLFSWTPTEAQGPDDYTFDVVVSDDQNPAGADRETITISVAEVNTAPILDSPSDQTITATYTLSFTVSANDADDPAQDLTYSLNNAPTGATINTNSGLFEWTPTKAQDETVYSIEVIVNDDGTPTLSDTKTVMITVLPVPTYTLTIHTTGVGTGTVTLDPTGNIYDEFTVVTMTASPDNGFYFGGWDGDLTSADEMTTVTMDADKIVTATFTTEPIISHTLTIQVIGNGVVTPDGGNFISGTVRSLTASPDEGWQFEGWSGDLTGALNPADITLDTDKTVTATFSQILHTVTVTTSGDGQGTVLLDPPGGVYAQGSTVTVTASAANDSEFSSWAGDLSGTTTPTNLTIDSDKAIEAIFILLPVSHTLSVHVSGSGIVSPTGGTYLSGTVIALTATPIEGWQFDGWSGDASGSDNPTAVTMDGDKSITAIFSPISDLATVDLSISLAVSPENTDQGDLVTYGISFQNISNETASDVIISSVIPSEITIINVISSSSVPIARSTSTIHLEMFEIASLAPGQSGLIAMTAQLSDPLPAQYITKTVVITASNNDSNQSNNLASASVLVNNLAPIITPIADQLVAESETVTHTIKANDPNGDGLTYSLIDAPTGATIDPSSGQFSWTPTQVGQYTVTVTVTDDGIPSQTDSAHFVILVKNTVTILDPETETTAVFPVSEGITLVISAPVGAVSDTVTLDYTSVEDVTNTPAGFQFAGMAFNLNAYDNNTLQSGFTFIEPIIFTLTYRDEDIVDLDEGSLQMRYFDEDSNSWQSDGVTIISRDLTNNQLTIQISHLTTFAMFGTPNNDDNLTNTVLLPAILR
ncbi:MAG: putative Ig domain-containing protein, partial [Chloroflexota bacterium]